MWIAAIDEIVCPFGWREALERAPACCPRDSDGSGCLGSRQRLEFGENLLDRIEILGALPSLWEVASWGDSRIGMCPIHDGEQLLGGLSSRFRFRFVPASPRLVCASRRGNRAIPIRLGVSRARRRMARAAIYDGGARSDAARTGGGGLQIVRDRVLRFNAEGPDGLLNREAPGARSSLAGRRRQAL